MIKNKMMVLRHEDPQNPLGSSFEYRVFATLVQILNQHIWPRVRNRIFKLGPS